MKKLTSLIIALLTTFALASAQSGPDKKEAAEKKAAAERQRSMGGYKTNNEMKDEKGEITPVSPTSDGNEDRTKTQQQEKNAPGPVISPDEMQTTSGDSVSQASNAPTVIQPTTSESGSPSILSENNGRGRDGTGNVQRAKPNMAGAEVPGDMDLEKENSKKTDNKPGSSRVREEEEMPAQINTDQNTREQTNPDNKDKASAQSGENKIKDSKKSKRKKAKEKDKNS